MEPLGGLCGSRGDRKHSCQRQLYVQWQGAVGRPGCAMNDVQLSMGVIRVELGKSGKEYGWNDGVELECTKCLIN